MASEVSENSINLLLVGDCGVDISATANNIIGEKKFQCWNQQSQTYQEEKARVQGHDVTIVVSPGLKNINNDSDLDQLITEMKLDDFGAMLIVIPFGRISQEDKWVHIFQLLEALSDTDYIKQRGLLVVIPLDKYRPDQNNGLTIEEFLQEEKGVFQELREKCNNRLVAFDNRTKNQSVRQNQVKRLLEMVIEMKKEVGHYKLSSLPKDLIANMDSQAETMSVSLEERVKTLMTFIRDHENIPLETFNVKELTEISAKLKEYRKELTEKNAGKNDLTPLLSKISNLEDDIIARIDNIRKTERRRSRDNGKHGNDKIYCVGEDFITFLLVGKTGQGKSSTGNSILGEEKFKTTAGFTSGTKSYQREVAKIQGHNVVVVDSPGLADTDIENDGGLKQLANEIIDIFAAQPDGFDVILITIPYGSRITAEDRRVFDELDELLSKEYVNHCGILVVTHVDEHETQEDGPIKEFMEKQQGTFQHLRQNRVNNRVVYFDNKTKDDSVRQTQVKQLLDMAVGVKKDPQIFIPEVCVKAQKTRDKSLKKAGKPVIPSETTDQLMLVKRESLTIHRESKDIQQLENIITKLQQLYINLEDVVEDEKTMDTLLCTVRNLEGAIRMKISAIEKNDDEAGAEKKIQQELSALEELLTDYDDLKYTVLRPELDSALATPIYEVLSINSCFQKIVPTVGSFVSWLRKK